jgi:uncharacterized RDD family membrane protein YckC
MEMKFTTPNYIQASKTIRALNFIIDIIFIRILRILIYFIAAFIPFNTDYNSLLDWFNSFDRAQNFLLWTILMFLYYSILEIVFARTLSKYFTKTIVVMIDGSKSKPIDILGRTLIRIIPFEYFTFLRGRKLGWHDELSKTFVVKKDKLEQSLSDFKGLLEIENAI